MGKKTDDMRDAIKRGQSLPGGRKSGKPAPKLPAKLPPWHPAAAATAKKPNPRSAAARDARAKARGRLPNMVSVGLHHTDGIWWGEMRVSYWQPIPAGGRQLHAKEFHIETDGQFRTAEELDVLFWNWFAAAGDEDIKALLEFSKVDRKPEPMPKPATEEKT